MHNSTCKLHCWQAGLGSVLDDTLVPPDKQIQVVF